MHAEVPKLTQRVVDAGDTAQPPCAWVARVVATVEIMLMTWYEPPGTTTLEDLDHYGIPKVLKDKYFEKVINPYLAGVLQHPQSIEMREGVLHIRDVEGPKKTGSMEARLEAMEQQVFKCQGMVEHGLNANHMMIMEFTNKHKIDANDIGKHLSRLYDRIDHLQAQIYDLQN
ncbi:40S ribosomal protein S5-1 [Hordeum vulgare]|nr:40S ribosomal protein S5-1 [Hordeum vulgare]